MKQWILRAIILTMFLSSLTYSAWAMENYSEVLRDQYGRAIGGATVLVYMNGTSTLATIYSDNGGTVKTNPFLTDAIDGRFNFYAPNGVYDLIFSYPGATFDASHTRRISLFDVNDFSGGGGGTPSCYRLVSATAYTVVAADTGCLIEFNGPSPIAVTLPQAGTTGFGSAFRFTALNRGSDDVVITPTVSTIQGGPIFTLSSGQSTDIASDGANYLYTPGIATDTGWPTTSTNKAITWADSEANCARVGTVSSYFCLHYDATDGLMAKPFPLADTVVRAWANQRIIFKDLENNCNILVIDPDAATPNAAWSFGCTASKPKKVMRVALSPRGAVTMNEESIVTNQPKSWYATVTDSNTDAVDFSFSVSGALKNITTAVVRLYGLSKNAAPSGNIDLDCAMKAYRPGTDTFAAHDITGEQDMLFTPVTQNRPLSVTSSTITINGTVAEGAMIFGSCEVDATATTSTQMTDFRLWGFADLILTVDSLSD